MGDSDDNVTKVLVGLLITVVGGLAVQATSPWWVDRLFPPETSRAPVTPSASAAPPPTSSGAGPSGPTAVVPTAVEPSVTGPAVRNATERGRPVTLELGHGLDLDSSSAGWGVERWTSAQLNLDLVYDGVTLGFRTRAGFFTGPPTPSDCANPAQILTEVVLVSAPRQMYFCVLTSEGRWSAVTVRVPDLNFLSLDITTWQQRAV